MSLLPPIFQTLRASSAVVAAVDARIYRNGAAPQGTAKPYLTWALVSALPQNQLSSAPSTDYVIIQVDCWADDDAQCEDLAVLVRDALEPFAHMTGIPVNQREQTGTTLYRIALQFDWWHYRVS